MKLFMTTTQSAAVVTALLGAAQTSSALNADGVKFGGWGRSTQVADIVPNKCGYQEFSSSFVSAAESRFAYVSPSYWGLDSPCGRCAEVKLA
ncbi:hypothetical protein Poli38472_005928 [Pythium oligandrum]|uniref:Uncharacterized protein n=1 Tax=Pythium oligandrum TaxID=41045 RepID=A0A8K1FLP2_PYTOL|nr:hypothetical protein Poli38472_005928 [Pythium oligandrum]|eukprot:TMW68460.1 hypothetical protein Poli38472_005928 [Pythium oligandrum]